MQEKTNEPYDLKPFLDRCAETAKEGTGVYHPFFERLDPFHKRELKKSGTHEGNKKTAEDADNQ